MQGHSLCIRAVESMTKFSSEYFSQIGLKPETLPKHVAIIMDGNGRWASKRALTRSFGHRAGTNRLREIIRFSSDAGIEALSLYAFSTENWSRPSQEVGTLMNLLVEYFQKEIDELHENNVRILGLGDIRSMPEAVYQAVHAAELRTAGNTGLKLNIALNYGSHGEILHAVKAAASEYAGRMDELTDDAFSKLLYTKDLPALDLLIRTGGEQRLSNFLLYQAAYAELYFTEDFWPDFTVSKYIQALQNYEGRQRRFGGVKEDK